MTKTPILSVDILSRINIINTVFSGSYVNSLLLQTAEEKRKVIFRFFHFEKTLKYSRLFIWTFAFCLGLFIYKLPAGWAVTFFGEVPQGLVELKDYHDPVYVFVPPGHDKLLLNSMILLIPDFKEVPDQLVAEWLKIAKKANLIVMVPTLKMDPDDVPYRTDEWVLKIKRDLVDRYHVGRTYVIGKGVGAHYAAYLAVKHPQEFSGAGLIDGSWVGPFEKLTRLSARPLNQVPFFISLYAPDAEWMKQTENRAYRFTAKGYLVYLERFEKKEIVDPVDVKARMMDWLQKKAETWAQVVAGSRKTKKEKISNWLGELIASPVHH